MQNSKARLYQRKRTQIVVCIAFFLAFLFLTLLKPSLHTIDKQVNLWIPSIQTLPLTFLANGIALTFDTTILVLLSMVISGLLFLKHHKPEGLLLLGAMAGDALIVEVIKTLYQVTRPINSIAVSGGFSYPSGHSAGVVVFVGTLVYLAWRHWHGIRSRAATGVFMGALVGIVGFDRIYLNVHWLSDVLSGWLFGAFWLSFVILIFRRLELTERFESRLFSRIAIVLYVAAVVVSVFVVWLGCVP